MAIHKQIKYIRCNKGISEWSERSIHHLFDWWLLMFYCLQLHNSCGCSIFLFLSWIACRPLAGDILAITPLTVQLYYVINHFSLYCFFIVCIANWVVCGQLGKNMEKYMEKRLVRALSQNRLSVSRCSENNVRYTMRLCVMHDHWSPRFRWDTHIYILYWIRVQVKKTGKYRLPTC